MGHFYNYLFCHSANFSAAKTSCFLSIMKQVLRSMIAEHLTSEETFDLTKTLFLRHSVTRPPYSVAIFSANDLKVIMDYVLNTFFRHFNLYQYVYVPHRHLNLRTKTHTFPTDSERDDRSGVPYHRSEGAGGACCPLRKARTRRRSYEGAFRRARSARVAHRGRSSARHRHGS